MRDLIDDLLTYSRAGRGDPPLVPGRHRRGRRARRRGPARRRARGARSRIGELPIVLGDAPAARPAVPEPDRQRASSSCPRTATPVVEVSAERDGGSGASRSPTTGSGSSRRTPSASSACSSACTRATTTPARHRAGDRQEGRRAPRRHDLGRAAARGRQPLQLHPARGGGAAVSAPLDPAGGGQRRRRAADARGAARGRGRRRAGRGPRRRAGARVPARRGRARRRGAAGPDPARPQPARRRTGSRCSRRSRRDPELRRDAR